MPALAPYLGPRAHLSLSWLTQTFLALLLLAISLSLLLASIPYLVKDAKQVFTAACHGAEEAADVMVSLPYYMADGVNELNAKAVNLVTHGSRDVLDFGLLAIQEIALFMIDMYRSLFLCLLDLVVHGSLDLVIAGVKEAEAFITSAFQDVRTEMLDAITEINKGLNSSVALIDKIPGVDVAAPQISLPTLSALNNVTFSSTLVDSLTSLNSSIPTLSELRATLDTIITTPITLLRTTINSTLSNATITVAQLSVPDKETVELCQNLDTSFIDDVGRILTKSIHIALGVLAVVTVLSFIGYAIWENYRYKAFLGAVERGRSLWRTDLARSGGDKTTTSDATLQTPHLLAFLSATDHPTISGLLSRLAVRFRLQPAWSSSLFWLGNYVCHPHALMFLALGVVGIIGVEIQLAVIEGPIRDAARNTATQGAGVFAKSLTSQVDALMGNSSAHFANSTNSLILGMQDDINNNLFSWVNTTTTAINSTLNAFYTGLTGAVTDMFNNTVLQDPALDLVYCLIGSKVSGVETALTFIHDHAHLSLPTVSPTILTLSSNRTNELTSSLTSPNSTVSTTSVVNNLIDRYAATLRSQRHGFIICVCLWLLVLCMGLFGVWWAHHGGDMWERRRRGARSPTFSCDKFDLRTLQLAQRRPVVDEVCKAPERGMDPLPTYTFPPTPLDDARSSHAPQTSYAAGRSWASLVDFFSPGHDSPPSKSSPDPNHSPAPVQRFQMSSLHLPALGSPSSGGGLRSRARRDSETIDLRTGGYLHRPLATGTGRLRGAVGAVASAMRGFKSLDRNPSLASSFGPRGDRRAWDEVADETHESHDPPRLRQPAPAMGQGSSFLDYRLSTTDAEYHRNPTQMPLSPPPNPVEAGYPSLGAFPALVPDHPRRQPSQYQPNSGRPDRNPFRSPFDGPGDT